MIKISSGLLFLFILLLSISCEENQIQINALNEGILLIEDLDSEGGLTYGAGGDIVFYSLKSNEQFILTSDNYQDDHPTYSKYLNQIFFESNDLRSENYYLPNKTIFILDIESGKIDKVYFDSIAEENLDLIRERNYQPKFDPAGKLLIFTNSDKNSVFYKRILVYDLVNLNLRILKDSLYGPLEYIWSPNSDFIVYKTKTSASLSNHNSYIAKTNRLTGATEELIFSDEQILNLGDIDHKNLLFLKREREEQGSVIILLFNLETKKEIEIFNTDSTYFQDIKDPLFYNENNILFMGSKNITDNNALEDVYKLNYNTGKVDQITFTENIKENISLVHKR